MTEATSPPKNQIAPGHPTDPPFSKPRGATLHVINRYIPYGASRNLHFVLDWEARHGYEPHIAMGGTVSFEVPQHVVVHRIPTLRRAPAPIDDVRSLRRISDLIESVRPVVLQTHQSKSGILGRLAARGRVPAVIHTIHMPSFGAGYSRLGSITYRALERRCASYTDLFVAVSKELEASYLEAGIGRADQYTVIRSRIDLESYVSIRSASRGQRSEWRRRYRIPAEGRVILVAGLLEARKRVDLIIRRLTPLLASGRATLVVAGDGNERKALETLAKVSGLSEAVMFLGFVSEFAEILGSADVLVHASTSEGIAQVVLQAAASGTPVVATEAVGLAEIPGKTVAIVDRQGAGLLAACELALAGRSAAPAGSADFGPWSAEVIDGQLRALHDRVASLLRGKTQWN